MVQTAEHRTPGRARALLALGAGVGLALAVASLLSAPDDEHALPDGVVARVGEVPIRADAYARLVAALASDRRTPLTSADRQRVLDRLVDEELLVQYAVALGLVQTDRRVRANLVTAVLAALNAAADSYEPSEEEIAAFYAENSGYFALPARVRVRRVFIANGDDRDAARERAEQVFERLEAGEPLDRVREALGDDVLAPVPDAPLPPAKLREYLGPTALQAALALEPGQVGEPLETPQGFHVLALVDRTDATAPPLDTVRAQVLAEMKRREGDRRLRQRLDDLREETDVVTVEQLPELP
ncbi:MAG: peptidylprolyl isomerase [Myxococcota bacterium]|nr:peptidylprolyl isomerase [Myxococcota bacterium]